MEHEEDPQELLHSLVFPICASLITYKKKDFKSVVQLLYPLRFKFHLLGGYKDEQEIFMYMLQKASIHSQDSFPLAQALCTEMNLKVPSSSYYWHQSSVLFKIKHEHSRNEEDNMKQDKYLKFARNLGWKQGDGS